MGDDQRQTRPQMFNFRCPTCDQGFNRQEHLTRHMRRHTQEKPYRCPSCQKCFSRPDVLSRHMATHEEHDRCPPTMASSRACKQCAVDRVRCSRGAPCRRCLQRRLPCTYPTPRRARSRADELASNEQMPDLAAGLTSTVVQPEATPASFTYAMEMPAIVGGPWSDGVGDARGYDNYNQLGLGVLNINWLSPQDQDTVDLEALMSGFASNQTFYSTRNGTQLFPETFPQGTSNNGAQQISPHTVPTDHEHGPSPDPGTVQTSSIIDSEASSSTIANRYYVDGSGARAPFGGRSHHRDSVGTPIVLQDSDAQEKSSANSTQSLSHDVVCPHAAYDRWVQAVEQANDAYSMHVNINELPTHQQLQLYVRQYFDNFHVNFPFLRKSSFPEDASEEWLLLLAVAAIGSRYTRRPLEATSSTTLFFILSSTLRIRNYGYGPDCDEDAETALFVPGDSIRSRRYPNLRTVQAGILNIVLLLHSGKNDLVQRAHVERHYLVEACHELGLIAKDTEAHNLSSSSSSTARWLKREAQIRAGMMIWFLDSMLLYQFEAKPLLALEDLHASLPSHEDIWERPELATTGRMSCVSSTLQEVMEMIYIKKRLPRDLGDFSVTLLINAIYRNTMVVSVRSQFRLNSWIPTAFTPHAVEDSGAQNASLSSLPATSKWRNSACDCLDVLHWPANSRIAQNLGFEHHTILQLHLARIIILTPTTQFQAFATGLIGTQQLPNGSNGTQQFARARYEVLQWAIKDECKARLAVVHAGALYWHIRRYSCDSVLEPYAIYIATLVLWSFCLCMQLPEVVASLSNLPEDDPEPSFLHLDRPLDDELVQTFVRIGHKMSAFMSNVGSLQESTAPAKILLEGISLLSKGQASQQGSSEEYCHTWGIEESYVQMLRNLLGATQENSQPSVG